MATENSTASDNPSTMEGYIQAGIKVLDHADKIPKALIRASAGIMLLNATEVGLLLSAQGGIGVAMSHKDGKWSAPIALDLLSVGAGVVFGYAEKDVIILLNHFAMDRLLKGNESLSIGVEAGFAIGNVGRAAAADIAASTKGGLGSSFIYTFSKGALLSVEAIISSKTDPMPGPMYSFYGTSDHAKILEGEVPVPEGSSVPALLEKLAKLESEDDAEESAETKE